MNCSKFKFVIPFVAIFVMGIVNSCDAQEWARKMFKEYSHSFGKVPLGEIPEYRFEIQNVYEEDITIQQVTSSCGCTIATPSKRVLKTWEKGEIICRFNSPAVGTGFKQATVTVRMGGQFVGECQLTVSGTIVGGLNFAPETIDFGQVTAGKMPARKIKLSHNGNPYFNIVDIKSTYGHIKVQKQETARRGSLVNYDLVAQLKDSAPIGYSQGELFIVYTENANMRDRYGNMVLKQAPLKFTAKVGSPVQIAPQILTLGKIKPGEQVSHKVFLKADVPFEIKDVKCKSDAFTVRADPEPKKVHIVEVTYTGEPKPGKHECDLSFYTTLGNQVSGVMKATVEIQAASVGEVSVTDSAVK
jgi:hypothetical protein